jgi:photosystem II stability/assembly factor-like uncharacterized protein
MKTDLSRTTFDPASHYSAVRQQQGRVVTDADWNEQADLTRYRSERQGRDVIGACGGPFDAAGFGLVSETNALAVNAVNASVAWLAAEDGGLLRTIDGGGHWTLVDLETSLHPRAMQHAGGVGWLVGDGGMIRKSTDAGATWTAQFGAGTSRPFRGVAAANASHVWAVGDGGIVVATSDGGASWSLAQTDAGRLDAVQFVDLQNGVAVGQGGAIRATRDGKTWTSVASGTTAHLRALAVSGTTLAWAAGDNGTIVRRNGTGGAWQLCNTPSHANLNAIAFRSATEGWAVGEGGVVLHSIDGGVNWTLEYLPVTATLRGLSVFGNEAAWAVGDASTALRLGAGSPDWHSVPLPHVNLSIEPGRYYVNGTLCELEARAPYANQPDGGAAQRLTQGPNLIYLKVWQRHLSYLEAPAIREVALGGPDTATRARTMAQVRALALPVTSPFDWNCDSPVADWDELVRPPAARLTARAEPQLAAANICEIAATAGYTRLENQLYRVEIQHGGAHPAFKWSRENGCVAYAVVAISTQGTETVVRVAARGRDQNFDLAAHDVVELVDDNADRDDRAGVLLEYLRDGDDALELVLAGTPNSAIGQDPSLHPIVRRWDHGVTSAGARALDLIEGEWIDLEDGVQVRFEPGGSYRAGDYWQIPARTFTGDVEWPRDEDGNPIARPPAGITDTYCRLGIAEVAGDGTIAVLSDCRQLFPPLTALRQLLYVSGDGQDAAPGALLPQPLTVRVARGSVPVPGAVVRFEVRSGGGMVGGSSTFLDAVTDDGGVASCRWTLATSVVGAARFQRVLARLLDDSGQALPGQIVAFGATASLWFQYVSGDGQEAAPNTQLPHDLEVRVANGSDGIAGARLQYTVEQGGGQVIGANAATTGAGGLAAISWRLGASGPQRLRVDLIDSSGLVLQRQSFNASITASGAGRVTACDVTIGKGGDFENLDNELLNDLLRRNNGRLCICFLPGTHEGISLETSGQGTARLSLHGCGQASVLVLRSQITLVDFAALEMRDLVLQSTGDVGVSLGGIEVLNWRTVQFNRSGDGARTPCLHIIKSGRVAVYDCDVATALPAAAMVLESIRGDCHVENNRFNGPIGFYGIPVAVPDAELRVMFDRTREARLTSALGQLKFSNNVVSLLGVGQDVLNSLTQQNAADGVFDTVTLIGNTITEAGNVVVAGRMMNVSNNTLLAQAHGPYGLFVAERATATGNLALQPDDNAPLLFAARSFQKAANVATVVP